MSVKNHGGHNSNGPTFSGLKQKHFVCKKAASTFIALAIFTLVCWWYFSWVPHLNATYGFGDHFSMGMPFATGVKDFLENWVAVSKRFYSSPLKYFGFALFVGSIVLAIYKRRWLPLAVFFLPFISFLILLLKTGANIIGDHYYILTAIPSMAFITGWGLSQIRKYQTCSCIINDHWNRKYSCSDVRLQSPSTL